MLDAGGGGEGYGGTNWSSASVIDMWLAVGNQETTPHWELLTGWRKSYELTQQHISTVKSYRENLTGAWPPETSAASVAYIERLDDLIEHLQHTYDAAVANYSAFSSATLALSSARGDLEKVVNEYLANQNKLAAFEEGQANKPPSGGLLKRPAPSPPVTDEQQARLEARARAIMYGLSTEIIQARAQITQPPRYVTSMGIDNDATDYRGTPYSPPSVPPIVPAAPGSSSLGSAAGSTLGQPRSHGIPSSNLPSSAPNAPGLVLGGTDVAAPSPLTPAPNQAPIIGGPPNPPVVTTGPFTNVPTRSSRPLFSSAPTRGVSAAPDQPIRAMPPGGIIGAKPTVGLGQPASGNQISPLNPLGGVLNPNISPGLQRRTGRAQPAIAHPFGTIGGRGIGDNGGRESSNRCGPESLWETQKGVDPVVRPPVEQRVDPGPAIGLN